MSGPITDFEKTVSRAISLLDFFDTEPEIVEADDILRASVTLAVAAYDHYFTSKFVDVLKAYLKKHSPNKELVELLNRAGLNTRSALEIAVMKRPFRRIRSLLQSSLSEKTTHRNKAIDGLFNALDLHGLAGRAQKDAGRNNLATRIDKLVDIRNSIVHCGHIDTRGNPKKISSGDVRARIQEIKLFVETCDKIIDDWVKKRPELSVKSST